MGLIRKAMSVSTFGGVKYTSLSEAQTKLALEQAKMLREERKAATPNQWDAILASFEAGDIVWGDLSRMQKLQMPIGYQVKCRAAERRNA